MVGVSKDLGSGGGGAKGVRTRLTRDNGRLFVELKGEDESESKEEEVEVGTGDGTRKLPQLDDDAIEEDNPRLPPG